MPQWHVARLSILSNQSGKIQSPGWEGSVTWLLPAMGRFSHLAAARLGTAGGRGRGCKTAEAAPGCCQAWHSRGQGQGLQGCLNQQSVTSRLQYYDRRSKVWVCYLMFATEDHIMLPIACLLLRPLSYWLLWHVSSLWVHCKHNCISSLEIGRATCLLWNCCITWARHCITAKGLF